MTLDQAKRLYCETAGENTREKAYSESEWEDIHKEMEAVVSANSDRAGGKVIMWWDCWDEKYTATAFAKRIRQNWEKMKTEEQEAR